MTVERGLIALANLVFDAADHILSGHFGVYSDTYEDTLQQLRDKGVVSQSLYQKIKGLGGFRNILVHDYLKVDLTELQRNLLKAFEVFRILQRDSTLAQDYYLSVWAKNQKSGKKRDVHKIISFSGDVG